MTAQTESKKSQAVIRKLSAARTRLILEKPFLGALVLRLPLVEGDASWCYSTATDAKKLYYNENYIDGLSLDETQFVLAHEALHCALSHFNRRQHRIKRRWDIACDLAINPLLIAEGFTPPRGALIMEGFDGMSAEEIYPTLDDQFEDQPHDQHIYEEQDEADQSRSENNTDGKPPPSDMPLRAADEQEDDANSSSQGLNHQGQGQGEGEQPSPMPQQASQGQGEPQPPPLTKTEKDNLDTQWQQRLAGAAQQAMQAGKLSGSLARLVDELLEPRLPWRSLLAHYMSAVARDDYTYTRPSSRRGDPAVYPSLRSGQVNIFVALDTSGSISDSELAQFVAEVDAIKAQLRARVVLQTCDNSVAEDGPWYYEPWDEFAIPREISGGGGTDFSPLFAWVEQLDERPDILVYFTDAEGDFPEFTPAYPVLWLVKGRNKVPWGQRIQLN